MTEQQESLEKKEGKKKGRGILGLLQSTVAAIFGIQSDKNREQDFKQGDASQFIAMGIIAVIALVITMIVVVNNVLDAAAK